MTTEGNHSPTDMVVKNSREVAADEEERTFRKGRTGAGKKKRHGGMSEGMARGRFYLPLRSLIYMEELTA